MQLNFKTRGKDVSPQGKPRVYFCCHPDDFSAYFQDISTEILNLVNCAIFFDEQPNSMGDSNEWESRLSDMQLFVMPVTSKLLSGNNKGLDDYHIALKKHIPVLPLMQEDDLDQLFNQVCGNLQFLNKYQKDETAISYQEKLKSFLDGVLVGDETAKAIRGAFRSCIFLSYRKKDRAHAQRLMRLIHKSELCRDIAIWYDEYLVPGEDFNNAIGDALNKSQLFVLSVTPNLVCESNYVQAVEYPMAKQSGKFILPVEMSPTDKRILASQYANLPTVISESDEKTLMQELAKIFPRDYVLEEDLPRYHLVALAYLDGVDVEVDHAKALEMLTFCAEKGYGLSMKALADMYKRGKGVERDINVAIQWQTRLVETLKDGAYTGDGDAKYEYILQLSNLAMLYKELLQYEKCIEIYQVFKDFCVQWSNLEPSKYTPKSMLCLAYNDIGEMYNRMYQYQKALENYQWALHYAEEVLVAEQTAENYNQLVITYCNIGRCHEDLKDYASALKYYEARLEIIKIMMDMSGDDTDYLFLLMQCYLDIFDTSKDTNDIAKAREVATKALELAERIASEQNDSESQDWLLLTYNRMATLCYMEEDFAGEREWYLKSLNISIQLVDQYASLEARQTLAEVLQDLADNASLLGLLDEAEDYISKAVYLREMIVEEVNISQTKFQLALAYSAAAILYDKLYKSEQCIELLQKAEKLLLELVEDNKTPKFRSTLADCYYWMGYSSDVGSDMRRQSYEKGLEIMLDLYNDLKDDHTLSQVAPFYYTLANVYAESEPEKALEYYLKTFEIELDYAQKHESINNWRQCIVDLDDLGVHYHTKLNDDESAWKCFENALEIGEDLLQKTNSTKVRSSFASLLGDIASFYEDMDDLPKAIEYAKRELSIHQDLAKEVNTDIYHGGVFSVSFLLAQFYDMLGDAENAKMYNIQALDVLLANIDAFKEIGYIDETTVMVICKSIGDNCFNLQQFDQALEYYQKALDYAQNEMEEDAVDQEEVIKVLRNVASCYKEQQNYSQQLQYAMQVVEQTLAIAQAEDNSSNLIDCATDCKMLAECYENLQDYQTAIEYYNIAKSLFAQVRDDNPPSQDGFGLLKQFYIQSSRLLAEVYYHIGDCYYREGDMDKTIEHFAPAIEISLDLANLTGERRDWMLLATYCYYLGCFAGIQPLLKAKEVLEMLLQEDSTDEFCQNMLDCVIDAMKKYQ
ncbi:MAG: tetratricopeptide repeat protein [Clostridia bacterium]|nr:tetratricopeptide repeat protein [Clostridia bacterium]